MLVRRHVSPSDFLFEFVNIIIYYISCAFSKIVIRLTVSRSSEA